MDVIVGDEKFYPEPMKDFGKLTINRWMHKSKSQILPFLHYITNVFLHFIIDYPWAGSLKPVSNKMGRRDHPGRRGTPLNVFYYVK